VNEFYYYIDPWLIAPYRWLADGAWAWWLGTMILAVEVVAVGWLTVALGKRANRSTLRASESETSQMHEMSMEALKSGDKPSYKAFNKLANDAFGKRFFQMAALGIGSLWPAFIAAGWLQERLYGVSIPLPGLPGSATWLQGYVGCYLVVRLGWWGAVRLRGDRKAKAR
jgi:hypothetical protein